MSRGIITCEGHIPLDSCVDLLYRWCRGAQIWGSWNAVSRAPIIWTLKIYTGDVVGNHRRLAFGDICWWMFWIIILEWEIIFGTGGNDDRYESFQCVASQLARGTISIHSFQLLMGEMTYCLVQSAVTSIHHHIQENHAQSEKTMNQFLFQPNRWREESPESCAANRSMGSGRYLYFVF